MGVVVNPQIVILYDANGVAMAVQDGVAIPASTPAILVAGSDGTNAKYMRTAADGTVRTDPTGTTTQPVSVASLPLPTGAATSANQTGGGQKTQVVDGSGNVMPAQDTAARAAFQKVTDGTNTMAVTAASAAKVDGSAVTQPISAASLPLPTGAATSAIQTDGTQKTQVVDGSGNVQPALDVVGRAGFFKLTDGTNTAPTMDVAARAGFQKLTDGTNVAAVKAASTAAAASDPSAVVALSPNSPLPAGTNTLGKADQGAPNSAANRWPVQHTDGTNFLPTADVAARALFSKVTDGTNTQPTGDAAARKIFVQPTDGTNNQGYDAQNHAFVAGKSAVGVAPTGNPVAVSGVDDGGLKRAWLTWTDGSARFVPNSHRSVIHNNATITATGSTVLTGLGMSEWYLVINLKNAPTGTTPTITFKIEAVDPVDQTTVIDATTTVTGLTHTAAGVEAIQLADNITDTIKITWTVTGSSPSWSGVNVSWVGHVAGNAIEGQAEEGQPLEEGPVPVAGVDSTNNVRTLKVAADGSLIVAPTGTDKTNGTRAGYVVLGGGTSGSFQAVRGTAYTEQTSNAQRSVSSSSASDTSAGTGARVVTITYYTATGTGPFTEDVTLNGTTAVATVSTTICFIESIIVKTVGSNGSNVGTITLFVNNAGGGGTIGTIAVGTLVAGAGDNRTLWGHHYVATGKTCNVTSIVAGASASTTFLLRSKDPTSTTSPDEVTNAGVFATQNEFTRAFGSPLTVVGPARITLYGIPSTNGVTINGAFDFYE